ncbi:hypothetical protein AVEN_144603-1 [Araneus ventricosus]|uniref:Uncharacterized protein n=1 Tax=Araneus ventricosus TaxID=182803 RepID=A0A4Y2BY76_ARAVE|nr:hypothetical protein AVEN_144603-1 [Araneus ventricosus]
MQLLDLKTKDLWSGKFTELKSKLEELEVQKCMHIAQHKWPALKEIPRVEALIFGAWNSLPQCYSEKLKLSFNGLSFHRFRPRFALFPVVVTGRIHVAGGLISASVVSRVVAVNSSHIKGPDGAIASVHSSTAEIFAKPRAVGTARLFEFQDHNPQVQTSNDLKFGQATRRWNKALEWKVCP